MSKIEVGGYNFFRLLGVGEFRRQTFAPDGSLVVSTGLLADVSFVYESTVGLNAVTADVGRDGRYLGLVCDQSDYVTASQ